MRLVVARPHGKAAMDRARTSPYPHYSWLAHWLAIRRPRVFELYESRHVAHQLFLTTHGEADIVWATDGTALSFHAATGDIGFFPCDFARHSLAITATEYEAYAISIPDAHLHGVYESEEAGPSHGFSAVPLFRDAVMAASLLRLSAGGKSRAVGEDIGDEIAARQILLRLSVMAGGRSPAWQKDTSVFVPQVMRQIVERLDAHLGDHLSLEQVSTGFGLSPSHFARKFQQSTGLSLQRFMNRRRIGLSLTLLRVGGTSLAQLSLDLGFSSQSHFTRIFTSLTGLTPHHFRQLHRRMGV